MHLFRVALASALPILLAATAASAEDNMADRYAHRHHHDQSIISGSGLPSVVPGVGTFVGNLSAVRIRGNGIFFAFDRRSAHRSAVAPAPAVQIIEISAENEDSACSFEAGVCVIRPRR
ncbi:hypothetical protein [Rhizobium sp. AG855]|uniref:hypothetical protein n=1 Tax=Rhizobium sp. AG855 TaxID=2183898 RepID=UPI000E720E07|nr:hypothetical protein [Rhizobium sp. AG855]RKE80132.1 hypothetical protein DFO46_3725 [Rhizobium sp. AG855]